MTGSSRRDEPPSRPAEAQGGRWLRRRSGGRNIALGLLALLVGTALLAPITVDRADGAAVLIVVEDALPPGMPGHTVRGDERRADSLLLVQWDQRCDTLRVTSVPRDLVLSAGTQTLSVLLETDGLRRIVDLVQTSLHVRVAATVTLDVGDVEAIAAGIEPVTIDLPVAARDQRTGFSGGPGPVSLDPERLVAFLRARNWEQLADGRWEVISRSDEARIARLQALLRAVDGSIRDTTPLQRAAFVLTVARNSAIHVIDPVAMAGFAIGAASVRATTFAIAPVLDERTTDDRRSPFAPADLEAAPRLVLAPDTSPGASAGCRSGSR